MAPWSVQQVSAHGLVSLAMLATRPTKAIGRFGLVGKCMVCVSENAKYTCPRCRTTTCCLACVKQHKSQSGCSGVRDKTAFVAVKDFSENHLLSDYRFLEDADRKCYSAVGDIKNKPGFLNFRWKLVSKEAYKRHIRLRLLPHHFTKHRENSTSFNKKTKLMMWHVKWIFPQAEAEYINIRLQETVTLKEALCKYIHPETADPVIRQRLKRYCSCGVDNVQVFMKVENQPANVLRYHQLSLNRTLKDNLVEKCLVEYPTMHVVLPENAAQYPLLTAGKYALDSRMNRETLENIAFKQRQGSREPKCFKV
ncbi:box C/D snoRNA protein 1-like [Diadema antillarum]|uniref:box C/D snoRNA protein 1-like n=1 Tax=Diadema antillarum TaxID=105358 RepID=UPI003A899544